MWSNRSFYVSYNVKEHTSERSDLFILSNIETALPFRELKANKK